MNAKKERKSLAKPVQAHVNAIVWDQLKIRCNIEGRTTGEVLTDAIKMYLENKKNDWLTIGMDYPFGKGA